MAESTRRGDDDAADDRLEDEAFDDDAAADDADDHDADAPVSRGGGTATRERTKADSADSQPKAKKDRVGVFARIGRFFREVVAELRKVIWPTRKELLTYTAVVIAFLSVMTAIVVGLDFVFARGVLWVFGNPS